MLSKSKTKYIQSLGHKKYRDEEQVFIAEGPKLVKELLTGNSRVLEVYATKNWINENNRLLNGVDVNEIEDHELEKISLLSTPNQVLAVVKQFDHSGESNNENQITLALDTIQDPGNLGTIIRIADWFGIKQVVCSNSCADLYNPKTVQSTMGSIDRVKVLYKNLKDWLQEQDGKRIYAAVLDGMDITEMKKISAGIILIGNESKGLSPELMALSNVKIRIPGKGKAESLNAAVATGIILSHLS